MASPFLRAPGTQTIPVNIKGWTLDDKSGHSYRFGNLRLNSHSQIRVHTGIGHDNRRDLYQDRRDYVWDDTGDTATLRDDHRRVVDAESWGRAVTDPLNRSVSCAAHRPPTAERRRPCVCAAHCCVQVPSRA